MLLSAGDIFQLYSDNLSAQSQIGSMSGKIMLLKMQSLAGLLGNDGSQFDFY